MIRLLCLVSAMNAGGAETFLMKIYRRLDRSKYQMDFCVNVEAEGLYDAEIRSMGGKIYHIPSKSENIREFSKQLYDIVYENGYKNVLRVTSNGMGFYDLHVAKKAGAVNCIARSSNSSDGGSLKSWIAHRVGKLLYKRTIDVEIAPSDLAAIYTFGKSDFKSGKVTILNNGIDFAEYRFSMEARNRIRAEFGIDDNSFLMGHIGRFTKQKNHDFILKIFAAVHKVRTNTKILLVGDGELLNSVREKCRALGIEDAVILSGVRRDVPALLSAMDLFIFPSLYEGMPNVIIEAQAAGLKCIISDRITKEVKLSSLVEERPINSESAWINEINSIIDAHDIERTVCSRNSIKLPQFYDIREITAQFSSFLV